MRRNRLGASDLWVSEVGFGCMSIGEDEGHAIRLLHAAFDTGINFFDTADLYGRGRNEELVGKAFRDRRSQVILATKVGNRWEPGQPGWRWDPSKAYIHQAVRASLRRLGTDYIDLYQLHGGTIDDPIDETIEAFEELQQQGLIRYYGISSIRPNVIREYVRRSRIVSVMMQYSILDRRPEEAVLELLTERGISVIGRGPVAQGMLSANAADKVPADGFLGYSRDDILRINEQLAALTGPERSLAQLAIRYPLAHPAVATVVPGASSLAQLEENARAAASPPLTPAELAQIRAWTKPVVYEQHR
ncbi:MAG: aldo/keto reductase [Alicyclobacillaceae bacterium]|nr:aldo/keto reductase [Alicyclobacillaceae bacterium]